MGSRVLDIACGTGDLLLELAPRCTEVAGVDLDAAKIAYALGRGNAMCRFAVADATSLPFDNDHFDVATLSMALHGMSDGARRETLVEALRVAPKVIVLDYAAPLPTNATAWVLRLVERSSPAVHLAGFRSFLAQGGVAPLARACGLQASSAGLVLSGCLELWTVQRG